MGKSGPIATFNLFFLRLHWPWVGEFVGFIKNIYMFPNPTDFDKSQSPYWKNGSYISGDSGSVLRVTDKPTGTYLLKVSFGWGMPLKLLKWGNFPEKSGAIPLVSRVTTTVALSALNVSDREGPFIGGSIIRNTMVGIPFCVFYIIVRCIPTP